MGASGGPKIVSGGLIGLVDATTTDAQKEFTVETNLLASYTNWSTGSGSSSGFSRNGSDNENSRVSGIGPFGETTILWNTLSTSGSNADGGWNGSYVNCDNSYYYRISVWVKRTSTATGGTFYLGTNGSGAAVLRMDNGASQGNPYWECRGIGGYTKDIWYLAVGHIHPVGTSSGGASHSDSGRYTISNGKIGGLTGCNVGNDMIFASGTTAIRHRTYHYYDGAGTGRLSFVYPRIDKVDGNEPTISELLLGRVRKNVDITGKGNKIQLTNNMRRKAGTKKALNYFLFDGVNDYIELGDSDYDITGDITVECTFSVSANPGDWVRILGKNGTSTTRTYGLWYNVGTATFLWQRYGTTNMSCSESQTVSLDTVYHFVGTSDGTTHKMYINGVLKDTQTVSSTFYSSSGTSATVGKATSLAAYHNGKVYNARVYNTGFSENEVKKNFRGIRKRFGLARV